MSQMRLMQSTCAKLVTNSQGSEPEAVPLDPSTRFVQSRWHHRSQALCDLCLEADENMAFFPIVALAGARV